MRRSRRLPSPKASGGFTLIEVLATMTVVGVLVGLMLPAVQSAREAARRMQCRSRLRELTLAVHEFHDCQGALPPLEIADSWATWAVFVLPYVDQSSLYNNWQLNRRYYAQLPSSGADLPVFHCPSRPAIQNTSIGTTGLFKGTIATGPPGWSDFGACAGTSLKRNNGTFATAIDISTGLTSAQPGSGIHETLQLIHPGWRLPLSFKDHATDGLSNTVLLGEMHLPPGRSLDSVYDGDNPSAYSRLLGHDGARNPVTGQYPAEFRLVDQPGFAGINWSNRFGSSHAGMCHFSFADGSVRALNTSIDFEVLDRYSRREDGQPIQGN